MPPSEPPAETARRRIEVARATALRALAASLWRLGVVDLPGELDAILGGFADDVTRIRNLERLELAELRRATPLPEGVQGGSGEHEAADWLADKTPTLTAGEQLQLDGARRVSQRPTAPPPGFKKRR